MASVRTWSPIPQPPTGTSSTRTMLLARAPAWAVDEPSLEEIVLGYMSAGQAGQGAGQAGARLSAIGGDR
jgi:hypothetical protein